MQKQLDFEAAGVHHFSAGCAKQYWISRCPPKDQQFWWSNEVSRKNILHTESLHITHVVHLDFRIRIRGKNRGWNQQSVIRACIKLVTFNGQTHIHATTSYFAVLQGHQGTLSGHVCTSGAHKLMWFKRAWILRRTQAAIVRGNSERMVRRNWLQKEGWAAPSSIRPVLSLRIDSNRQCRQNTAIHLC